MEWSNLLKKRSVLLKGLSFLSFCRELSLWQITVSPKHSEEMNQSFGKKRSSAPKGPSRHIHGLSERAAVLTFHSSWAQARYPMYYCMEWQTGNKKFSNPSLVYFLIVFKMARVYEQQSERDKMLSRPRPHFFVALLKAPIYLVVRAVLISLDFVLLSACSLLLWKWSSQYWWLPWRPGRLRWKFARMQAKLLNWRKTWT